ncbi:dirigent protein 4-like [Cornus florida]|uniref:dirigent protein 4-like n=1 Tax=Cornus florida TaxID=4283 RepID=UPI00289BA7E7|nr:dirigent protein 4-like [Cornus florida]
MALTRASKVCLLLLMTMFIFSSAEVGQLKETNMTFYLHEWSVDLNFTAVTTATNVTNATAIPVTGIPGFPWTLTTFGTMFCADDPITVGFDKTSAQIGRAQGIFVTSALDGSSTHVSASIVFTNATYNGSTIEIQGASHNYQSVNEVAVVGGTGIFRYARGYATFQTVYQNKANWYAVAKCNVTVLHY